MADPIKVVVRASDTSGTDAPTVDDLLGQLRDFVDVLRGVEKALETDGSQIDWRVTNVSKNSPLSFELTPYAKDRAAFVDQRAARVERATSEGLLALRRGVERPPYFTNDVLPKAHKLYERVTNGLADTEIVFPAGLERVAIDREGASEVTQTERARATKAATPYRELGSLEGYFARAELDGHGRPVLWFRHRIDDAMVKAVANGPAIRQLEQTRLGEVWSGVRLRVYGTIHYKAPGAIDHVNADFLEVINETGLPGLDDIIDEGFASGLTTEE